MKCLKDGSLGILRIATIQRCLARGPESRKSFKGDFKRWGPIGKCGCFAVDPPVDGTVELPRWLT